MTINTPSHTKGKEKKGEKEEECEKRGGIVGNSGNAWGMLGECWGNAGGMLGECWGNAGGMLGECWGNAGGMLGECWGNAGRR